MVKACGGWIFAILVVLAFSLAVPVFAGGGGTGDRSTEWLGQVSPRVDFDSISYAGGTMMGLMDGKVVLLRKYDDGIGWLVIEETNTTCTFPVADKGILGYNAKGQLCRWNAGRTSVLYQQAFKQQIKPACSEALIVFGGDGVLVFMSRTGKSTQMKLPGFTLKSVTIASDLGAIYFTASDGLKSRLYLAYPSFPAGYRYNAVANMEAEQVCYGASRLYLVDKWGITSWYIESGQFKRDSVIMACAGPYVLCGGDKGAVYFFTGYGGVNTVGVPDPGKG